jgi:hypothetical protein
MISPLPLIRASFNNRKSPTVAFVDNFETARRVWNISMMDFLTAHSTPNAQLPLNTKIEQ